MIICSIFFRLMNAFVLSVSASEITAPSVSGDAISLMPDSDTSFADGLLYMLGRAFSEIHPEIEEAGRVCLSVLAALLIVSALHSFSGTAKHICNYGGIAAVCVLLLVNTNTMIQLGTETVEQLSEYGKLLLPVMTTAVAFQGGVSTSTALYVGTAFFNTLLTNLLSRLMIPGIYIYLALAIASGMVNDDILKKTRDLVKQIVSWCLKLILTVFTTYMGITGVISGTTDAAALKATKVTISSFVPVVGSIMSDASEAVLISAGLAKNAAGIYGIFALLALFLRPFIKIGIHYLFLKGTASVCDLFTSKSIADLVSDFSGAMGLVLAMTGTVCLLLLVSTVCFLRGMG